MRLHPLVRAGGRRCGIRWRCRRCGRHCPYRQPMPSAALLSELPPMTAGEEILADYSSVGLSLKGHPVGIVRAELARRRIVPAAEVWNRPPGRWVRVAGVVLIRQRPGDGVGHRLRHAGRRNRHSESHHPSPCLPEISCRRKNAALLEADGYIERQGKVQHVITFG